jgi:hypothetical protein
MEASLEIQIAGFEYVFPKPEGVIGKIKHQQPTSIFLFGVDSRADCDVVFGKNTLGRSWPPESKPNLPFFFQFDEPSVKTQTMKEVVLRP